MENKGANTIRKYDAELEEAALPECFILAWYSTLPVLQVENALSVALRFCVKSERVIAPPLLAGSKVSTIKLINAVPRDLPFLLQSVLTESHLARGVS